MKIELLKSQNIALSKLETNKGQIEGLPKNPRLIKTEKFEKLKKSIEDNPEMLGMREVLVYPLGAKFVIIGGNMRFQACKELGFTEVPCKVLDKETTAIQLRAITIKDNVGFGEHDWDLLANEWEAEELEEWGMDVPNFDDNAEAEKEEIYTTKIQSPIYEPKNEKPSEEELYNLDKYNELIAKIHKAKISDSERLLLQMAATRHIEFNYRKIADFYANSEQSVQELIEDSALIIIDYDKAVEDGFVRLFQDLENISDLDD
jgi:hypothetical protein